MNIILRNSAKCPRCLEELVSHHTHDFKTCTCGGLSIDGGNEYLKRSMEDNLPSPIIDTSIEVECSGVDDENAWIAKLSLSLAFETLADVQGMNLNAYNIFVCMCEDFGVEVKKLPPIKKNQAGNRVRFE